MACTTRGGATTISAVHEDIIRTHILTRLHGPALASAAATSSQFHALASDETLWSNICHSTWPSTDSPRIRNIISTFPRASRSFFSDSFTTLQLHPTNTTTTTVNLDRTPGLISAVDLHYRDQLVFSKVVETETVSGWFRCSPFRVDLLDPKDVVQTPIQCPKGEPESAWKELREELRLSWIVIDAEGGRAMNVSSQKAVSVTRHWLSGEVQMEDMEGMNLNGRDSLVILQRALEGKRGRKIIGEEEEEARKRYQEFVERKRERKEKMVRAEGRLDMFCVGLVTLSFLTFFYMFVMWS
ncbi:putative F-box protein [Senna tora]|uniref:Putative F-box protein n=1 Tax=Senna tora TaxID=362788 RepID=A0A834TBA7_9FABA|nr:putative F-box protein [Senna tora]